MGNEIPGDELGDQFKGYVFKITGGNDKDGFSMKQGILVNGRVRLLMAKGAKNYRPRRAGERKRKSVRGSIVGPDIAVLALAVVKVGEVAIAGLTDDKKPRRLGPKRANKIRKLFNLKKDDDVKRYVIKREIVKKEGTSTKKSRTKAPKIQRLITDVRLRRKKIRKVEAGKRRERTIKLKEDYVKLIAKIRSAKAAEHKAAEQPKVEPPKAVGKTAPVKATTAKGKVVEKAAPGKTQAPAPTTTKKDTKAQAAPVQPPKKTAEVPKKDDKKTAKTSKK